MTMTMNILNNFKLAIRYKTSLVRMRQDTIARRDGNVREVTLVTLYSASET